MLQQTLAAGEASFLTVLFGDRPSPGLMSFPMPGATLTLDFPNRGERTERLLARLDSLAIAAGGRVNPYKDARMSSATFAASFPRWRDFAAHIDPGFSSDFWRRVTTR
jgi:FAD/FMN-containing dehydrogenase